MKKKFIIIYLLYVMSFRIRKENNSIILLRSDGGNYDEDKNLLPSYGTLTNSLGNIKSAWTDVYTQNGAIQISDGSFKSQIDPSDLGLNFIRRLRPVKFVWNVTDRKKSGKGSRDHYGFIAQDIKRTLDELGIDFGGFIRDKKSGILGLRYNEFICPVVRAIQELSEQVEELHEKPRPKTPVRSNTMSSTGSLSRTQFFENDFLENDLERKAKLNELEIDGPLVAQTIEAKECFIIPTRDNTIADIMVSGSIYFDNIDRKIKVWDGDKFECIATVADIQDINSKKNHVLYDKEKRRLCVKSGDELVGVATSDQLDEIKGYVKDIYDMVKDEFKTFSKDHIALLVDKNDKLIARDGDVDIEIATSKDMKEIEKNIYTSFLPQLEKLKDDVDKQYSNIHQQLLGYVEDNSKKDQSLKVLLGHLEDTKKTILKIHQLYSQSNSVHDSLSSSIQNVQKKVDNINSEISQVKSINAKRVNSLEREVLNVNEQINDILNKIRNLNVLHDTYTTQLRGVSTKIEELQKRQDSIIVDTKNSSDKLQQFGDIQQRLDSISKEYKQLESKYSNLKSNEIIHEQKLLQLEKSIQEVKKSLNSREDDYNLLHNTLEMIAKRNDSIQTELEEYREKIRSLNEKRDKIEKDVQRVLSQLQQEYARIAGAIEIRHEADNEVLGKISKELVELQSNVEDVADDIGEVKHSAEEVREELNGFRGVTQGIISQYSRMNTDLSKIKLDINNRYNTFTQTLENMKSDHNKTTNDIKDELQSEYNTLQAELERVNLEEKKVIEEMKVIKERLDTVKKEKDEMLTLRQIILTDIEELKKSEQKKSEEILVLISQVSELKEQSFVIEKRSQIIDQELSTIKQRQDGIDEKIEELDDDLDTKVLVIQEDDQQRLTELESSLQQHRLDINDLAVRAQTNSVSTIEDVDLDDIQSENTDAESIISNLKFDEQKKKLVYIDEQNDHKIVLATEEDVLKLKEIVKSLVRKLQSLTAGSRKLSAAKEKIDEVTSHIQTMQKQRNNLKKKIQSKSHPSKLG
jgi:chromosome segregation ATPase